MAVRERGAGALSKELSRVLQLFARTARARQLYHPTNVVLKRMLSDLTTGFTAILNLAPEVTIKVRPEALLYEEDTVLEEPNPDQSIPFVYYRDGIRRFDFSRGLESKELETLLEATAQGFNFSGFGDDIVARLWHTELEHVRYLVVDTTIVDSGGDRSADSSSNAEYDVDAQIEGLIHAIYGDSTDDVGPKSLHVDRTDIPAKAIAEQLDEVDAMAPGFHPARTFIQQPAYARDVLDALAEETDSEITASAAMAALTALDAPLSDADARSLAGGLLRMFDASLVNRDIRLASKIVSGVRSMKTGDGVLRSRRWLEEGASDARLRQVVQIYQSVTTDDDKTAILRFFRACGPLAVPSLLGMLPSFPEPSQRRKFADAAIEIGIDKLELVSELVTNEQAFAAEEGIYILSQIESDEARRMLVAAKVHPHVEVRMAVLSVANKLKPAQAQEVVVHMLEDGEPKVRALAAQVLGTIRNPETLVIIERIAVDPALEQEPYEVKRAVLVAYANLTQVRALSVLANYIKKGDGLLSKKEHEELGAAAVEAIAMVRTPRTIEVLKKAVVGRSKRIREAARGALVRMKEGK